MSECRSSDTCSGLVGEICQAATPTGAREEDPQGTPPNIGARHPTSFAVAGMMSTRMKEYARNSAPGSLDAVRTLLNTYSISHTTREPVDELTDVARSPARWRTEFSGFLEPPTEAEEPEVRRLRNFLRATLNHRFPAGLQAWLDVHAVSPQIDPASGAVRHRGPNGDCTAGILAIVVDAVADNQWRRLRACPGCDRVFYDRSPNLSRIWCGMYAGGPKGRACGTIAKVSAYRARQHGSQ